MRVRATSILLLALAALAMPGCGGGSGNSDESRLRGRYSQWQTAIENERIDSYMLLFSPSYLDEGYSYVDVRNFAAALFDQYDIVDVRYELQDIRVTGNFASVFGTEIIDAYDTYNGNAPERLFTDFNDIWHYESGDWFLYGNQRDVTVRKAPFRHSVPAFRANAKTAPLPVK